MRLLLGIGGSDDSWSALTRTAERVAETGDELTVAILDNPTVEMDASDVETKVAERLAEYALDTEIRHLEGDPGAILVETADSEEYDRIVLGGGKRSPMGKIRVGQIAEFVVLNAETSVTLIR